MRFLNIVFNIFLISIFFCFYSCFNKKDRNDKDQWIGERLIMPEIKVDGKKIVVRILGDCPSCIETFDSWQAINKAVKLKNKEVKLVFYVEVIREEKFKELKSSLAFADYVVFDQRGAFYIKNLLNFPDNLEDQAFLLNENNEILFFGNPAIKKELIIKYIEKI